MSNIFAAITAQSLRNFGEEPVCAHIGDVEICTVKRHPTYRELRNQVRLGRTKTKSNLRTWETIVTLAKEGEKKEREKWLLIALDLVASNLDGWARDLARTWHYEVSDIKSVIVEGLLSKWDEVPTGETSNKLLDDMMKHAFNCARALVEPPSKETCAEDVSYWTPEVSHSTETVLLASSIIDSGSVLNPDADERIRGERVGALLHRMGAMSHVKEVHEKIREGVHRRANSPVITPAQVGRSWVDGKNIYYHFSELLPQYIAFKEAAKAVGLSESQASRRARSGASPFRVLWVGNNRVVTLASLMQALNIPDPVLHPDDVENGAFHASGGADQTDQ
ncbi:hypothetical protein AB0O64_31705 [Streptomyces sp. NPDC088341]|uniref:hypothetical protein n=1 Tax=Streptomyces sp. NPDC088341 TaxID=3154870 RepID=UPI003415A8D6